jgi:exodeoxyribonuclease-5
MRARQGEGLAPGTYGESFVLATLSLQAIAHTKADQVICGRNRTRQLLNGMIRDARGRSGWMPAPGHRLVCLRNRHALGMLNGTNWIVAGTNKGRGRRSGREIIRLDLRPEEGGKTIEIEVFASQFFEHFDFGYTLTCHKTQGYQWDSVLLVDESGTFGREARRWLYTGVTRAAKRIAVVQRVVR